jgi:hypothetical protein
MKKLVNPNLAITITAIAIVIFCSCGPSKKANKTSSQLHAAIEKADKEKPTYGHLFYEGTRNLMDDNTYKLDSITNDETYGYSLKNPIMVGWKEESGPKNERRFLNALLGPGGEEVTYNRQGSCCMFYSSNGMMDRGLIDRYEVTYSGLEKPVIIFINMYDPGVLKAPKGFTFKK